MKVQPESPSRVVSRTPGVNLVPGEVWSDLLRVPGDVWSDLLRVPGEVWSDLLPPGAPMNKPLTV